MITFKNFQIEDYEKLISFLIELNEEDHNHIHWNWARLEWMFGHPEFDYDSKNKIGLWIDEGKIVGVAIYDQYFGEAFCGTLSKYIEIYPEILDYAFKELKDDSGLGIAICDDAKQETKYALDAGFEKAEADETMLVIDLNKKLPVLLPSGFRIKTINPYENNKEMQWLFWQGFNHGGNKEEFEKEFSATLPKYIRKHLNPQLSIAITIDKGELVSYCGVWYDNRTDYAYVEPVCTIPNYRKMGLAKAAIYEALNRAKTLGAKRGYVISNQEFYKNIGFTLEKHFSFYWKKELIPVNGNLYKKISLLGKGKGGYSYLVEKERKQFVLKQIHHEPCDYYKFGNKIDAEHHDYERLSNAGIRIPRLIEIDIANKRIIKEYIQGKTISEMISNNESVEDYIPLVKEMAKLAKKAGLNIDYYPTNFVVENGLLYYVDYECNDYMDEWSFDNWGIKYWKNENK